MVSNKIHDSILQDYLNKNISKFNQVITTFSQKYEKGDIIAIADYTIKNYLKIPKVTNLSEFSFLFQNLYLMNRNGWKSFHYRGESRDFNTKKTSTFFRVHDEPDPETEIKEVNMFKSSKYGKELEKRFIKKGLPENHYYWWFLTQHNSEIGKVVHGKKFETRLLDITKNPFVALYFCCHENIGSDGVVYVFYDLDITQIEARPEGISFKDKRKTWREDPYESYGDFIKDPQGQFDTNRLITIDYNYLADLYEVAKRIVAQSGEFIVQSGNMDHKSKRFQRWGNSSFSIVIDGESKQDILKELNFLMNINSHTLLLD